MRLLLRFCAITALSVATNISAIVPNFDMVDTPTAVTLPKGAFNVGFWAYDSGGVMTRAFLGLHDNLYIGVLFDTENVIGDQTARMNIPGVIARVKFTDGWGNFPLLIAMGYDTFYNGRYGKTQEEGVNPFGRNIAGPYLVFTKPVFIGGAEQHFHFGIRSPLQPNYRPEDTAIFFSFDFPLGPFVPMFEIERVYFDGSRLDQTLFNFGFKLSIVDNLSIELGIISGARLRTNRIISFEYMNRF
ncbi:MAG: hypothetical protein KDK38_02690 [Leptospiraceae bacterium]|nr:hypothetical protein [Leptospiraceae bacterium]